MSQGPIPDDPIVDTADAKLQRRLAAVTALHPAWPPEWHLILVVLCELIEMRQDIDHLLERR